VKSFAIRYCRAPSRGNVDVYIDNIINHFRPIMEYRRILLLGGPEESLNEENNSYPTLPIEEASRTEEPLPPYVRGFINNSPNISQSNQFASIAYSLLFMEMIMSIHESAASNQNRKFDIKMNVCEGTKEELSKKCECNICYEENENVKFINFDCGHKFCKECVKKSLQNEKRQNYCCAYCRKEIKEFKIHETSLLNEFNNFV
jgi:hypothetical protein